MDTPSEPLARFIDLDRGANVEIQTEITKHDWIEFGVYHYCDSVTAKRKHQKALHLIMVAFSINLGMFLYLETIWQWFFLCLFFLSLSLLCLFARRDEIIRQILAKRADKAENRHKTGVFKLTVNDDGISQEGQFSQSKLEWKDVEKIAQAEEHFFIYYESISAIIVPKCSFSKEADFWDFIKTVKEYLAKAKTVNP